MTDKVTRAMDGIIMKRIDGLDVKMDKVTEVVHKIDNLLTVFTTKFDGQVSVCTDKFVEMKNKTKINKELSIDNKDKIRAFDNQRKGSLKTISFIKKYIFPIILFIGATVLSYLKGKGVI